jgi:hypothetical protein
MTMAGPALSPHPGAMRDPAGLLFCVLPMSPGSLNDENAQRWE